MSHIILDGWCYYILPREGKRDWGDGFMAHDTQSHKVFIAFDLFFWKYKFKQQQISFYEVTFCPEYPVQNKQPCHYVINEVGNLNAKRRPSFKVKVTFVVVKMGTALINFLLCNDKQKHYQRHNGPEHWVLLTKKLARQQPEVVTSVSPTLSLPSATATISSFD